MKSGIKTAQTLTGFAFAISTVFFMIFTLLASLSSEGIIIESPFAWVGVAVFIIVFFETSVYWIKRSFSIREENLQDNRKKGQASQAASILASLAKYNTLGDSIFLIVIFLVLTGFAFYIFVPLLKQGVTFSPQFYALVGTYAIYFILIRRFILKILSKGGKFARGQLPTCSVEDDGVLINIKFKKGKGLIIVLVGLGAAFVGAFFFNAGLNVPGYVFMGFFVLALLIGIFGGKVVFYPIKILFSEIQEIKALSFIESQSFLRYKVGPDVGLEVQSLRDLTKFLKDPANPESRPNTYTFMTTGAAAKTLLIRGPKIFYLFAVGNEDVDEVIKKVRNHISKKGSQKN